MGKTWLGTVIVQVSWDTKLADLVWVVLKGLIMTILTLEGLGGLKKLIFLTICIMEGCAGLDSPEFG